MNHLAHFHLAGDEPGMIIGAFLGDFVKGRLPSNLGATIDRGIKLHRAIDQFTDQHACVKGAYQYFSPAVRRFAPIITDIVYDHFLAREWADFHPQPLHEFAQSRLHLMLSRHHSLPAPATTTARRMLENNSLPRYAETWFVERSLRHLSSRLTRENTLALGYGEFMNHYDGLAQSFRDFFPAVQAFSHQWQRLN